MARASDRLAENVAGDFFVDTSCIDCDLCRQLAPGSFARSDRAAQSFVARQPGTDAGRHRALMALVTCPTSSIGTTRKLDSRGAARAFPELRRRWRVLLRLRVRGFVRRGELADHAARRQRARRFAARGEHAPRSRRGARRRALDVPDSPRRRRGSREAWHARFGCERIAHRADAPARHRARARRRSPSLPTICASCRCPVTRAAAAR